MRIAEITRHETSQRAQLISVESYDIQLDLTDGAPTFGSMSVIRFDCRQLPQIWASLNDPIKLVFGQVLFPYPAASPQLLKRVDAALAAGDLEPSLARALIEGRDVVEKALRARALPAPRRLAPPSQDDLGPS
jgi:hypothetical protein